MGSVQQGNYSGSPMTLTFNGFLFDFDGTILDSTAAIVKHWHALAKDLGVDPEVILATSHGRRSIDTLKLYDESKANWDFVSQIEGQLPKKYGSDARELPGARDALNTLQEQKAPWAIVTSATHALLDGWVEVLDLPRPPLLVVAEDVDNGKPDPQCYRLGLERIGQGEAAGHDPKRVLVVEDAPAGVKAGKAAGCTVLGLGTTHSVASLQAAGADYVIKDLDSLRVLQTRATETDILIRNVWEPEPSSATD